MITATRYTRDLDPRWHQTIVDRQHGLCPGPGCGRPISQSHQGVHVSVPVGTDGAFYLAMICRYCVLPDRLDRAAQVIHDTATVEIIKGRLARSRYLIERGPDRSLPPGTIRRNVGGGHVTEIR